MIPYSLPPNDRATPHARNVFTYWTGQKPILIRKLLALMEFHSDKGAHYRFHLLDDNSIGDFVPTHPAFSTLSAAHQAEYAKVMLICKHGGIWFDADTLVMTNLSEVFEILEKSPGFLVRVRNGGQLVHSAFGSQPDTALMREWRDALTSLLDSGGSPGSASWSASILETLDTSNYTTLNGEETVYPAQAGPGEPPHAPYLVYPYDQHGTLRRDFQPFLILGSGVYSQYKCAPEAPIEYFLERSLSACGSGVEPGVLMTPHRLPTTDPLVAPEVRIYTVHDKTPDFLYLQHATLEKHCRDRYELVVLDNAVEFSDSMSIWQACQRLGLPYLRVPSQRHENANVAASYPLDYITRTTICSEQQAGFSVILDSDMFLMRSVSFAEFARDHEIAAVFQSRGKFRLDHPENHVKYLWNALVIFNHSQCNDLSKVIWACSACGSSPYFPQDLYDDNNRLEGESVDVGGPTHYWLKEGHKVRFIGWTRVTEKSGNLDLLPEPMRAVYMPFYRNERYSSDFLMEGAVFHYRAGTNWNGMDDAHIGVKKLILEWMIRHSLGQPTPYDDVRRHPMPGGRPTILVGICSCRKHGSRRQAVRETWFPRNVPGMEAVFFSGGGPRRDPNEPDLVGLPVEDDYHHIPAKVLAFFRYALDHFDFDWLFKCDDDTYLVPERLFGLTDGNHDLAGNEWLAGKSYASGGAGYMISREWVAALASDPHLPQTGGEDILITGTAVVNGAGILATENLCWHGERVPTRSNTLVSTHGLDPSQMRTAHRLFTEATEGVVDIVFHNRPTRIFLLESGEFAAEEGTNYGTWDFDDESNMLLEFIPGAGRAIVPMRALFSDPVDKPLKIGILVIATGRYRRFINPLISSIQRNFVPMHQRTVFLFTDSPQFPRDGVTVIPVENKPWPGMALFRYSLFHEHAGCFEGMDYLYYLDADMLVSGHVGDEILGHIVATLHPSFAGIRREEFTYEANPHSKAYIAPHEGTNYYCGAFQGGARAAYLGAASQMAAAIAEDLEKGIVAIWHDESHWNRLMIDSVPTKVLSPSYCHPEGQRPWYPEKITALNKDHGLCRDPHRAGPSTIIFRLGGGLGNQLFGYANALALARFFGCDVSFVYQTNERGLALWWGVDAGITWEPDGTLYSDMKTWDSGSVERMRSFIDGIGSDEVFVEGYFQNERYFADVVDEIRTVTRIDGVLPVDPLERTPVCIQVRRGDYVNNPEFDIVSEKYYSDAIRIVRSLVENPLIYVVSDDLPWCRRKFGTSDDFVIPESQDTMDGLRTMVACKALVISNSTYGWWGAWLADAPLVIAPDPWLGIQHWECVPSRWIRLPASGLPECVTGKINAV